MVDIPTAAALLDVSTSTLYRWISDGRIRYAILPSGVMRITLQDISVMTGVSLDYLMNVVRSM